MGNRHRILVVDDDENDLELFQRAVEMQGLAVSVATARDGIEALAYLNEQTVETLPKLLVIDYKMPRMDGVYLLKALREDPRLKKLPAVMLTSSRDQQDVSRAYAAGANAYLLKPVSFEQFNRDVVVLVKFWLQLNQAEA